MSATPTHGTTPGSTLAEELEQAGLFALRSCHDAKCDGSCLGATLYRRLRERAALVRELLGRICSYPCNHSECAALRRAITGPIAAPRETT
jgi:hypothetical protein